MPLPRAQGDAIARSSGRAFGIEAAAPANDISPDDRQGLARAAVAFAALTPEFLLR